MIEYKIIKVHNVWSQSKTKKEMEETINKEAKKGWRVTSVSFTSYYGAFATLERDKNIND